MLPITITRDDILSSYTEVINSDNYYAPSGEEIAERIVTSPEWPRIVEEMNEAVWTVLRNAMESVLTTEDVAVD